jgi:hypothetical protein
MMIDLNIKTANGEAADPKKTLIGAFLGIIDRQDKTMRLYPTDRNGYEESTKRGDKGMEVMSVRLERGK